MRVGDYTLLARIGEGGMGVVHLAQKPGGERVALKVLRPHVVGDDEARARLAREVNSLARIRSPRVAEIVDSDPWGPVPFVATRYVPGLALNAHVREEGPLRGGDLAWFAHGLAQALHAVHRVGVLHRDIKPSNVLMEGRNPVLIDFGLARVADDASITRTGWLLGTPGYLAPEILYGHTPTAAADVHSWAATVAFAATGRPPFGSGPSVAVMDRVRRGEHDLAGLDPELAPLVAAALDPEPAARPRLPQVLEALGGTPTRERTRPAPAEPPTLPLQTFDRDGQGAFDTDSPRTRRYDEATTVGPGPGAGQVADHPRPGPPPPAPMREPYQQPPPAIPPRARWPERLRRWVVGLALLVAVASALALAPWVTVGAVAVVTVLVRSLSLSSSAARARRASRGAKWYDGVLTVCAAPWHFLVSLPGTVMLLTWTALIVACVGLVLAATQVDDLVVLGVSGLALGLFHWTGPGSSRLRSPVRGVGLPVARSTMPWAIATVALLGGAAAMLWAAQGGGVQWFPFDDSPWSSSTWLGRHL